MTERFLIGILTFILIALENIALPENSPIPGVASSTEEGVSCVAPCILGPQFHAVGDTVEYSVTEVSEPLTVRAEDNCLPGDIYLLTVKRQYGAPRIALIDGSQVAGCTCTYSTLTVDHVQVTAPGFGTGKVRVKALKLPNLGAASLYLTFQQGIVTQTLGEDSCL